MCNSLEMKITTKTSISDYAYYRATKFTSQGMIVRYADRKIMFRYEHSCLNINDPNACDLKAFYNNMALCSLIFSSK